MSVTVIELSQADAAGDVPAHLVPPGGQVVLDLSGGGPAHGLRALLNVYRLAAAGGATVRLARVPADVRALIAATGFLDLLAVEDGLAA